MRPLLSLLPGSIQRKLHARPFRFLVAGGINTLVGFTTYPLLLWTSPAMHKHYMVALLIVQAFGLLSAFLVYKLVVFRDRSGALLGEFLRFSSFYVINYALNWAALPFLVEVARVPPIAAQICFAMALMVGSYFWHSHITFKPSETPL